MNSLLKKYINVFLLIIILLGVSEPYINASEIIYTGTQAALASEKESGTEIINETDISSEQSFEAKVNTNKAYFIDTDAESVSIGESKLNIEESNVIIPSEDTLNFVVSNATYFTVTELVTDVESFDFDIKDYTQVDFTYKAVSNVTVSIVVDGQTLNLKEGDQSYANAGKEKLVVKVYDPINKITDVNDVFTDFAGSNEPVEEESTEATTDETTQTNDESSKKEESKESEVTVADPEQGPTQEELKAMAEENYIGPVQRSVMPEVEYNVVNFDAPAGHFVPEESNLDGYENGHQMVSHVSAKMEYVSNPAGYVEYVSNDPGTLNPDGSITYNTCWDPNDDKVRFDCEGLFFPLNSIYGDGAGTSQGTQEVGIYPGEYITMYYPEALIINGNKYDVKAKFSDFYKDSDSLGVDGDGWYTTFAVSHYFYDGYWLNDFQGLTEEMTIYDSVYWLWCIRDYFFMHQS